MKNTIAVCILAYNEQKHIARTIKSITDNNSDIDFDIIVYANGCTDNTVQIVNDLTSSYPNLSVRDIKEPGKPNAWNTAFHENKDKEIIVFSDADIEPEEGSIKVLYETLTHSDGTSLASCQYWSQEHSLSLEQKFTGFLQIPIKQSYLTGHFYAIKSSAYASVFTKQNLSGIPLGVVAEDGFVQRLVPASQFKIIDKKCFYEPPSIQDYLKYLARVRWQKEQIERYFKDQLPDFTAFGEQKLFPLASVIERWQASESKLRFFQGVFVALVRRVYHLFTKSKVEEYYKAIGPIIIKGSGVLRDTRSESAK